MFVPAHHEASAEDAEARAGTSHVFFALFVDEAAA